MLNLLINKKKYTSSFELTDIKLQVFKGEITLLLGHNGSGKTTIIKSLLGLTDYEGTCNIDDKQVDYCSNTSITDFKMKVSYISDHADLFDYLCPQEYINLMKSTYSGSVDQRYLENLIKLFELTQYLSVPIKNLSYGNRKKVQIVSQLFLKPDYLIIDEPTNGLDPDMIIVLRKILKVVKNTGTGILLSTHHLDFGQDLMDRVLIIRNGKELLNADAEELQKQFSGQRIEEVYQKVNHEYYQHVEELLYELNG